LQRTIYYHVADVWNMDRHLQWHRAVSMALVLHFDLLLSNTIRYDTLEEFNVDSKADYTALSGTRIQKLQESRAAARKPRDAASVLFR